MAVSRFFTSGDNQGLFADAKSAANAISFDANGNIILSPTFNSGLNQIMQGMPNQNNFALTGGFGNVALNAIGYKPSTSENQGLYGGWGMSPTGVYENEDQRKKRLAQEQADFAKSWQSNFSTISAGDQYKSFYDDTDIGKAYPDQKPLTWAEYYKQARDSVKGSLSDGTELSGASLFHFLAQTDNAQGVDLLRQIEGNYDTYMADYKNSAVNFNNNTLYNQQRATDTDPTKRDVANYGVEGEYAPTGASGWGRGNVQSSEGFQDQRRRGWGQTTIQGV